MATSKALMIHESDITFLDTGGTVAFTCTSLATATGRQSAQHDFGDAATTPRPYEYTATGFVKFSTDPVVGETIDVYAKTSDGTHIDNDDGTGDIAVSSVDKLKNLEYLFSITVDEISQTVEFTKSMRIRLPRRYFNVVFWNATADTLSSTAADCGFKLTPVVIQGQAT